MAATAAAHAGGDGLERGLTEMIAGELAGTATVGAALYTASVDASRLTLAHRSGKAEGLPRALAVGASHFAARTAATRQPVAEIGWLALPLLGGGDLVGVLALARTPERATEEGELEGLVAIANIAALALGGARARRRCDKLSARIHESATADRTIVDAMAIVPEAQLHVALLRGFHIWPYAAGENVPEFVRRAFQEIVDQATLAAGAQMGALGIVRGPDHPFEPWVYSGVSADQAAAIGRVPRPVGTLGAVAMNGETVRVRDVEEHPAFHGLPPHHPAVTSMLAVPIRYGDVSVGNLYLANKLGAPEFSAEDQSIVERIANHAAQALQIAFLRTSIEAQRAQLQSTLDCAPSGILFVDADTEHVMANPRAMELLGKAIVPNAGVGQYLELVRHPDGGPVSPTEAPYRAALAGNTVRNVEALISRLDAPDIPVLVSAAPVKTVDDRILGAVVMFTDITAIKELERARREFAAIVAHDLRAPLSIIQLQSSALLRVVENNEVRAPLASVRRIQRSVSELVQMTNDLLDAARADLGRFALDRTEVQVDQLTEEIVEQLRLSLDGHPIELTIDPELPVVMLDRLRFEQVLMNLVDNAAKHSSSETPISIRLAPVAQGLVVAVRDQGAGIPATEIPMLFDRYFQANRSRSKRSGLGLGLYIAKGIVEAHEGRIWVESEVGQGTTFYMWFPAGRQPADSAEASPHPG